MMSWSPHFFVLTNNKIFFSELQSQIESEMDDEEEEINMRNNYFSDPNQKGFHLLE